MADRYRFVGITSGCIVIVFFLPLANPATVKRTPVLMGRAETGFIDYYNSHKRSPFGFLLHGRRRDEFLHGRIHE